MTHLDPYVTTALCAAKHSDLLREAERRRNIRLARSQDRLHADGPPVCLPLWLRRAFHRPRPAAA